MRLRRLKRRERPSRPGKACSARCSADSRTTTIRPAAAKLHATKWCTEERPMRRRTVLAALALGLAAALDCTAPAIAQQQPIKIGMSMPATGGLAAGGKSALIGIEIWRDDVNARGGLLGRKVE